MTTWLSCTDVMAYLGAAARRIRQNPREREREREGGEAKDDDGRPARRTSGRTHRHAQKYPQASQRYERQVLLAVSQEERPPELRCSKVRALRREQGPRGSDLEQGVHLQGMPAPRGCQRQGNRPLLLLQQLSKGPATRCVGLRVPGWTGTGGEHHRGQRS